MMTSRGRMGWGGREAQDGGGIYIYIEREIERHRYRYRYPWFTLLYSRKCCGIWSCKTYLRGHSRQWSRVYYTSKVQGESVPNKEPWCFLEAQFYTPCCCKKGDPLQDLKLGSRLTLRNELSEETHVLTKQEILLGKGTPVESSR